MIKWIKFRSVKHKVMLAFVILSAVLIVLQVSVFQHWINTIILQQAEDHFQETVRQIGKRVELEYQQIDADVRGIRNNQVIKNYLKDLKRNHVNYQVAKYQIARQILRLPNLETIDNIYIFPIDHPPMNLFYTKAVLEADSQTKQLMTADQDPPDVVWSLNPDTRNVSMEMPMYDQNERLGLLRVDLNENVHRQLSDAKLGKSGSLYLIDHHHTILFAKDRRRVGQKDATLKEISGVSVTYTLDYQGWKLTGVVSNAELLNQVKQINRIMLSMELLVLAFLFLLAMVILRLILKPLHKIMRGMESVQQGKLDVTVENFGNDEFSVIVRHFNDMVERVNHLLQTIYYQQHNYRKAKMANLLSKLNPHFLYNTLDMIYWKSVMKDEEEIGGMILSLSKILRYSISHNDEFVAVAEDMEQLENYLMIQRMRFEDKLQYSLGIDPDIADLKIPKLLIQPLVENAIKYAFEDLSFGGTIAVRAYAKEDDLIFEVEDNGAGMPEEKVRSLLSPNPDKPGGLGIPLVQQRIKYWYGKDCGLSIDSRPGRGTRIAIKLRKEAELSGKGEPHVENHRRGR